MRKKILGLMLGVLCLGLAGCGSSNSDYSESKGYSGYASTDSLYSSESAMAEESAAVETYADNGAGVGESIAKNRKLIKNVNLDAETEEYDKLLPNLENKVNQLGGYVESLTTNGYETRRYATITARIPADQLEEFLNEVAEVSNITYRNEYVQDVTLDYVDLESHKEMLEAEQKSLLELLEKAETVEDIIALESRLTDIRYQLESMESQLRTYDNQIEYSTVTISITEVEKVTPSKQLSAGEKMLNGFCNNVDRIVEGLKAFGIGIVINLPFIILFVIIILIFALVIKIILMIIIKSGKKQKTKHMENSPLLQNQPVMNPEQNRNPVQNQPVQMNCNIQNQSNNDQK